MDRGEWASPPRCCSSTTDIAARFNCVLPLQLEVVAHSLSTALQSTQPLMWRGHVVLDRIPQLVSWFLTASHSWCRGSCIAG